MAYTPSDPPSVIDIARARLGDLGDPPLLEDWVYNSVLQGVVTNECLAQLAEAIGSSLAQSSGLKVTLGDQTYQETSGDRSQRYFDLAKSLRAAPQEGGDVEGFTTGGVGSLPTPCPNVLDGYDSYRDPNCCAYGYRANLPLR